MKWIPDRTGAFPKRLYFESMTELDAECDRLVRYIFFRKYNRAFEPPLDDDTLQVLIEESADIDMYAELPNSVEAVTEFRPGGRPLIKLNQSITGDSHRRNRTRTGLAHEWFHAVYHRPAWEIRWARDRHQESAEARVGTCPRESMIGAENRDWMEFQAGYGSCALLIPIGALKRELEPLLADDRADLPTAVSVIAKRFVVSDEAARWRLNLLGLDERLRTRRQTDLFGT